jgi:hypothetical protein
MADLSMDHDAAYWQMPGRYAPLAGLRDDFGIRGSYFPMGDPDDDEGAVAVVLDMKPGYVITRHAHPCERFEVVVRGLLDVGDRILYPGDVMTAEPNEMYGPKVAGPEGCTTVEVFSKAAGAINRITEDDSGVRTTFNLLIDGLKAFDS